MVSDSELRQAMESLADQLDLPFDISNQDSLFEIADSNEIHTYLKLYDSLNNENEKLVLMQMIIHASHKQWESSGLLEEWERVDTRLVWDFGIHKPSIQKWTGQEDKSKVDPAAIALQMRKLMDLDLQNKTRILFVCTLNQMRSATAHHIYKNDLRFEVKSAGTHYRAETLITEYLIDWAELVFVMEDRHRNYIYNTFPEISKLKKIICLDIPDEYDFMDPELVAILRFKVEELVKTV